MRAATSSCFAKKSLSVSQWIHLRFFRSPSSFRLASRRPRYEATFETSSSSCCLVSWYLLIPAADAAGLVLGKNFWRGQGWLIWLSFHSHVCCMSRESARVALLCKVSGHALHSGATVAGVP